jgi:adenylate cyclase
VFGGVIGESRFHYKVFGDTVNMASRVQGHAAPGRALVSDVTGKRIAKTHVLEERGTIDLKGHGPMRTWWLVSRRA